MVISRVSCTPVRPEVHLLRDDLALLSEDDRNTQGSIPTEEIAHTCQLGVNFQERGDLQKKKQNQPERVTLDPESFYESLDKTKNEYRVLSFTDPVSKDRTGPLRLTLMKVSDDPGQMTTVYRDHQKAHGERSRAKWKDCFTQTVDNRGSQEYSVVEPTVPRTRFTWGDFEALSYAWGSESNDHAISIDGHRKYISATLHAALFRLRSLPETAQGMRYWVDALCINQSDPSERNHQVGLMRQIYSGARAVVVWLGEKSKGDSKAIEVMRTSTKSPFQKKCVLPRPFNLEMFKSLCGFFQKPYWSRLWIVQELAMNPNATLFLCGEDRLYRNLIIQGSDCCQLALRNDSNNERERNSPVGMFERARRIYTLVKPSSEMEPKEMEPKELLNKALHLARQGKVSNELDKVYGILGLLSPAISSLIEPDYESSVQDVFRKLTLAILETKNLDHIAYNASGSYDRPESSWVLNLSTPFPRKHTRCLRDARACADQAAIVSTSNLEGQLILRGKFYVVDTVDGIGASLRVGSEPQMPKYNANRYGHSVKEAFHRTLIMDHVHARDYEEVAFSQMDWPPGGDPNDRDTPRESDGDCSTLSPEVRLHFFRFANRSFLLGGTTLRSLFPEMIVDQHKWTVKRYQLNLALVSLEGRTFATTQTGYFCLVPEYTERGDCIAVILGCPFPVVLRPYLDGYRVVGECYTHGLMSGEVFDLEAKGEVKLSDLVLY